MKSLSGVTIGNSRISILIGFINVTLISLERIDFR